MDTESAIHAACSLLEQGHAEQALLVCDAHEVQNTAQTAQQRARWQLIRSWAHMALDHLDASSDHILQALRLDPRNPHGHLQHAKLQTRQGQDDGSLLALRRCLALEPTLAAAHFDLGASLHRRGHYQEAWHHYLAAFQCGLTPQRAHFASFAQAADYAGDTAAAEYFTAPLLSLADGRDDPYQHWLEGFRAFKHGHFELAWSLYDRRHHHPHIAQSHPFALPYWNGVCIGGKTLLVHGEQGLGDEIMFAGSLPRLLAQTDAAGMTVILAIKPGLCRLFAHNFPQCLIVPHHHTQGLLAQWPAHMQVAAHIPLANLPSLFLKTTADFEKNAQPYLTAPPDSTAYFGDLLDALIPKRREKLVVGLVWACAQGKNPELDARAIPADQLAALGAIEGLAFVSLHNQDHASEAALAPTLNILDLGLWQQDFCDTAGLIQHMDVVIGVDTATSHLAGAMGVRVLQPLLKYADWRRQTPGDQCIWYRNTRYFRQRTMFSWFDVLLAIRTELEQAALSFRASHAGAH